MKPEQGMISPFPVHCDASSTSLTLDSFPAREPGPGIFYFIFSVSEESVSFLFLSQRAVWMQSKKRKYYGMRKCFKMLLHGPGVIWIRFI